MMTSAIDTADLAERDLRHVWHPYTEMDSYRAKQIILVRGEGPLVFDVNDRRYIDGISGLWNLQLGHANQQIVGAISDQLQNLAFCPLNGRSHIPGIELATRLSALAPGNLSHVFYSCGGAEAVETAIKISRQFWRQNGHPLRHKIIGLSGGWHGCTLGALSASGVAAEKRWYEPLAQGFVKIPAPHQAGSIAEEIRPAIRNGTDLRRIIELEGADTIAAFIAEPIMGLAGMIPLVPEFWEGVQNVLREYDILFIVDEVAMGFGRTGRMFASEHYSLRPDMLTCAKGLTSGYLPLGATLATSRVFDGFLGPGRELVHGYTYGGHPASCAAALASLDVLTSERLVERAATFGRDVLNNFRARLEKYEIVGEIRGVGLAIAVELIADRITKEPLQIANLICDELVEEGVLIRPLGSNNVLPFIPPLNVENGIVTEVLDKFERVIRRRSKSTKGAN